MREAQRLHQVSEYYFSAKLREVAQMKAAGKAVLNIGIGSPDLAPDKTVIEALSQTANSPSGHGYQSYQGTPELRMAMADFYKNRFEVSLDADSEVLPMMGSKEAIMHISMAFLNPGDEVLIPAHTWCATAISFAREGAKIVWMDINPETFVIDIESIKKAVTSKTKAIVIVHLYGLMCPMDEIVEEAKEAVEG